MAIVSQSSVSRLTTTSRVARGTATRYAFRLAWRFHGPVHRSQAGGSAGFQTHPEVQPR